MSIDTKPRVLPLAEAQAFVAQFISACGDAVQRWSPVGSVRRREEMVGDIDVLIEVRAPVARSLHKIRTVMKQNGQWLKGQDRMMKSWNLFGCGCSFEVFLAHPPTNYLALLALRTGPASSTQALTQGLTDRGRPRPHAQLRPLTEKQMYEWAGIPWTEPEER